MVFKVTLLCPIYIFVSLFYISCCLYSAISFKPLLFIVHLFHACTQISGDAAEIESRQEEIGYVLLTIVFSHALFFVSL